MRKNNKHMSRRLQLDRRMGSYDLHELEGKMSLCIPVFYYHILLLCLGNSSGVTVTHVQ